MRNLVLYGIPLTVDMIVSLILFVGRHSLAGRGFDEETVGSIILYWGIGYVIASLLMTQIVRPRSAKQQMLGALAGIVLICILLANVKPLWTVQVLYGLIPFAVSLFFNAFQIYMLGISNQEARPLGVTVGHFTFSWSVGYALGPFASSMLKTMAEWSQIYYLAALLAGLVGLTLYGFRPTTRAHAPEADRVEAVPAGRSLVGTGWLGLLVGWTIWNAVLIYWPVQAVQLGIAAGLKGLVEFASALAQAFAALALARVLGWHHRPAWTAALGGLAIAALCVLAVSAHPLFFALGALMYGTYAGGMFSYMAYHSMLDERKAVQRVAINETLVGICFLASSPVASWLHLDGTSFRASYLWLAAILATGIVLQTLYTSGLLRQNTRVTGRHELAG